MSERSLEPGATPGRAGFTLIEVLAAVLLTSIVIGVAMAFYVEVSRSTTEATERLRAARGSAAVLDRVARDIQGALLVEKPGALDPLSHPWIFRAVREHGGAGADRVLFTTQSHATKSSEGHHSDFAVMAYMLERSEDGDSYELLRWIDPVLPSGQPQFPVANDERLMVLADGVESFSMRFHDGEGEVQDEWDSSLLVESSDLPIAVEIELALLSDETDTEDFAFDEEPGNVYKRMVVLPVRPIKRERPVPGDPNDDDDDDQDPDCVTVAECTEANPEIFGFDGEADLACGQNPELPFCGLDNTACWREVAAHVPFDVQGCEDEE